MRKIIMVMLIVAMSLSSTMNLNVFAEPNTDDTVGIKLLSLGVIKEIQNGDGAVTRGDFSKIAVEFLNIKNLTEGEETQIFSDVSSSNVNYKYINFLANAGYLNGYSDGKFYPEKLIEGTEAIKVFVQILGYNEMAKAKGGYPSGYLLVGSNYKIISNIDLTGDFTYSKLYKLILNSLNVSVLKSDGILLNGETESYIFNGEKALYVFFNIRKVNGIVTSNKYTGLTTPIVENDFDGFLKVDDTIYEYSGSQDYLGQKVECYFVDDEETVYNKCLYLEPIDNKIIDIQYDDLRDFNSKFISFENKDDKIVEYRLSENIDVIYNGCVASYGDDLSTLKPLYGEVKLLDNNSDSRYDVVFIYNYENLVATGVNVEENIIFGVNSNKTLDDDNFKLLDSKGVEFKIEDIKVDDILSVAVSKNTSGKKLFTIYVSSETVSGTVTEIQDEGIVILNDKEYKCIPNLSKNLNVNQNTKAFLDFKGNISWLINEFNNDYDFAVVIQAIYNEKSIDKSIKVKLFSQRGMVKNESFDTKFTFNNVKYQQITQKEMEYILSKLNENSLVCYKLNTKGKISDLYIPDEYTQADNLKLVNKDFSFKFRYNLLNGRYLLDSNAIIIGVPADKSDEDGYQILRNSDLLNGENYSGTSIYTLEKTKLNKIDVMVCNSFENTKVNKFNSLGIITKIAKAYDEDTLRFKIYGGTVAGQFEYFIKTDDLAQKINVGDIIKISRDKDGLVNAFELIYKYDGSATDSPRLRKADKPFYAPGAVFDDSVGMGCGYVLENSDGYIILANNYGTEIIKTYLPCSKANAIVFDSKNKSVKTSNLKEILSGENESGDFIVYQSATATVNEIIVIR